METQAKKIETVRRELNELNDKFHKKSILSEEFYKQLMQAGFAYSRCILISVIPDSSNTYIGQIIRQDGNVTEFDVDLDSSEYSSWKDITDDFRKTCKCATNKKPWQREVVAVDLFCELNSTQ